MYNMYIIYIYIHKLNNAMLVKIKVLYISLVLWCFTSSRNKYICEKCWILRFPFVTNVS